MQKKMNLLELKTPDLGDSEEIELVKWNFSENDLIIEGDELLELSTDKANFTMESPAAGVLSQILKKTGAKVKKHEVLGILTLSNN
jgi:pyruvate/2-oxoglutarate dehydrogenase complex dihydrolipoamide acyltransferase (E2) component